MIFLPFQILWKSRILDALRVISSHTKTISLASRLPCYRLCVLEPCVLPAHLRVVSACRVVATFKFASYHASHGLWNANCIVESTQRQAFSSCDTKPYCSIAERSRISMAADAQRWWSQETVAVVTGANKGVGFEIVKQLAEKGITVVLTSRDVKRGEEATKKLVDQGLPVVYHQLEVTSPESAQKLADWLKQEYGYVDILVNNAGVFELAPDLTAAVSSFEINFYGVKHVTKAILPLLRASEAGARIVNVSSRTGQFQYLENEDAKKVLANVEELSEEVLDKLVDKFYDDVKQQKQSKWVGPLFKASYVVSKATENAYTRLLGRELAHRPSGQKVYVNSFSPGFTATDMAKTFLDNLESPLPEGLVLHEADEAAAHAVWLILLPASESPSGIFSAERKVEDF